MPYDFDVLVVGAGYAGAVAARALAEQGRQVYVLERRGHIGGNAYDYYDEAGVLVHQYGPHIFHTNNKEVFDWLSRFTQWRDYQHRVIANIPDGEGRMTYPVPFNLTSLETAFGAEEGKRLGDKLIAAYGAEKKVTILELRQNPDPEISALADYVYEHVFVHYTMKQWGQTPEEIDPNTTARVPVFLSRDDRYFQDTYQGMPAEGYTDLFFNMLSHPNITVELGVNALDFLDVSGEQILLGGEPFEPENQPVVLELVRRVRERYPHKDVWCYSGYLFEALRDGKVGTHSRALLEQLDVLVDGPFIIERKDLSLRFRGSANQRLVDVPESLKRGEVVLWDKCE